MVAQHQGVEEESHRQARVRLWRLLRSSPCLGQARQTEPLCAATASSCPGPLSGRAFSQLATSGWVTAHPREEQPDAI